MGPASPPQPLYLEGTIGGAGPGPCCSWWLGLPRALVKSLWLGVDLVGAPGDKVLPSIQGHSFPEDALFQDSPVGEGGIWIDGKVFKGQGRIFSKCYYL